LTGEETALSLGVEVRRVKRFIFAATWTNGVFWLLLGSYRRGYSRG
jgi:hypothetical protein